MTTVYLTGSVSGGAATPANAVGAPDGTFTTNTGDTSWTHRWGLGEPDLTGKELDGQQTLTLRVRRSGTGNGACEVTRVTLIQGSSSTDIFTGSHVPPQNNSAGDDLVVNFDASVLDGGEGIDVEVATTGAGGGPNQNSIQLDAASWLVGAEDIVGTPLKYWGGETWVEGELKEFVDDTWVPARLKRFTGSEWEVI